MLVVSQFVEIGSLTLLGPMAAAGSLVVSPEWIALLGVVSLGPGLHALWSSRRAARVGEDGDGTDQASTAFLAQGGAVAGGTAANFCFCFDDRAVVGS